MKTELTHIVGSTVNFPLESQNISYIYIYTPIIYFVCAASSCLDDPLLIKFSGW